MTTNRSVPTDTVLPHLIYGDAEAAMTWLGANFGFTERYRVVEDDGSIHTAQLQLGPAYVMVRSSTDGSASPAQVGASTQSLTVFVDDVDAHYARTQAAGAEITEELGDTVYGERQYGARDIEGHGWLFSQHAHDVDPATFAIIAAG